MDNIKELEQSSAYREWEKTEALRRASSFDEWMQFQGSLREHAYYRPVTLRCSGNPTAWDSMWLEASKWDKFYILPAFDMPVLTFRYDIGYKLMQIQFLLNKSNQMLRQGHRDNGHGHPRHRSELYMQKVEAELRLIEVDLIC